MFPTADYKYNNITSIKRYKPVTEKIKFQQFQPDSQLDLLRAVVDSFFDGIIILSTQGEVIHANKLACCICQQLVKDSRQPTKQQNITLNIDKLPEPIWQVCQPLIDTHEQEEIAIEANIQTCNSIKLRVRARWLKHKTDKDNLLLVTLEDYQQTFQGVALADAKKYGLTDRETQVWQLRRANFSYQEIADQLYITINTVKKHLKNIYAKQLLW